jgi:ABC-2 type transport system ATP-binding protein
MEKGNLVRSGKIDEITSQESTHLALVQLSWLGHSPVQQILGSIASVSDVAVKDFEGQFHFKGSEEELAAVLQQLVAQGVRVLSFGEVKKTIEDLYLKLSRNEVM